MTSRLSGVTQQPGRSLNILYGSDLITVPGPCCALPSLSPPSARRPQIVISTSAAFEDYGNPRPHLLLPSQGILTSQIRSFTSWGFYELHLLTFFLFFLFFFSSRADSFLSSFPSDALEGIAERKVVSVPSHSSTSAHIKQNKNVL